MYHIQTISRLIVVSLLLSILVVSALAQQKKRLAVTDFSYQGIVDDSSKMFKQQVNVGEGVTNVLIDRLVKSNLYTVVERKQLSHVYDELKLNETEKMDKGNAVRVGQLVGADVLVYGSITRFGPDKKPGFFKDIVVDFTKQKAVVTLTFRMVSAETAEILFTGEARGESQNKGSFFMTDRSGNTREIDMTSSDFGKTVIGEAVYDAVGKLVAELEGKHDKLPTRKLKVEGKIAKVDGDVLTLTLGAPTGIRAGDKLRVNIIKGEIRDPDTKKVLDYDLEEIGKVVVTNVRENTSTGTFSGKGPINIEKNKYLVTPDN